MLFVICSLLVDVGGEVYVFLLVYVWCMFELVCIEIDMFEG